MGRRVEIMGNIVAWSVKDQDFELDLAKLNATDLPDVAKFLIGAGAARISFERGTGAKADDAKRKEIASKVAANPLAYFTPTEREARKPAKTLYEIEAARRFANMSRAVGDGTDPNHAKATARWRELGGPDKRTGEVFKDFRETYITDLAAKLEAADWKPKADF